MFAAKLIFPGIGDRETLDALSTLVGDWDRPYTSVDYSTGQSRRFGMAAGFGTNEGRSVHHSTQRERLLSPSEVATIPTGCALQVQARRFGLVEIMPFHLNAAWRRVAETSPSFVLQQPRELASRVTTTPEMPPMSDLIDEWIGAPLREGQEADR